MLHRMSASLLMCLCAALFIGCSSVQTAVVDPTHYLMLRNGSVEDIRVVQVRTRSNLPVPASSREYVLLTMDCADGAITPAAAQNLIDRSTTANFLWRNGANLYYVCHAMMRDVARSPRWIISTNPLMIAIGENHQTGWGSHGATIDKDGITKIGDGLRLVTKADSDRVVTSLIVLKDGLRDQQIQSLGLNLNVEVEHRKLQDHTLLGDLLKTASK